MSLTAEQKEQIESFGGLFKFSKIEICLITGTELTEANQSEIDELIRVGKLKSEGKLYQSVFKLAHNGSSEAQKQVIKIIADSTKRKY